MSSPPFLTAAWTQVDVLPEVYDRDEWEEDEVRSVERTDPQRRVESRLSNDMDWRVTGSLVFHR